MSLRSTFLKEVARLDLPVAQAPCPAITEGDIASLPDPARRYLRFMGVVGRPRDWSVRMHFRGRFKMHREASWRPCEVLQYNSGLVVARVFVMQLAFGNIIPVIACDTYCAGRGRMVGRLLGLFTVIDGSGEEYDIGELVTYLNDLVLLAPSMLLTPAVVWEPVDTESFDLILSDHGLTVRARVFIDSFGAPRDFETRDRFCEDPGDRKRLMRTRWTTPIDELRCSDGRHLVTRGHAVWHPPEGAFPYVDFTLDPAEIAYNVAPGE
ncbi:hypothetical protein JXA88_03465 [Candidatus Fermentibacteria bacterium]|nr:hypothetical protein [Candidatus Fermentibacteria bacterium]